MKKYIPNDLGLKVLGFDGKFHRFAGVAYMGDEPIWRVEFKNRKTVECSGAHKFFGNDGLVSACNLYPGAKVWTRNGKLTSVRKVHRTARFEPVYDLVEVEGGHAYSTNGVMSKNCDFVSDDETLINPLTLSFMQGEAPAFFIDDARFYSEIEPNCMYLVALDPAQGTLNDAAAIQIFKVPGMEQVGEWQSNSANTREQMRCLLRLLWFIDDELRSNPEQRDEPQIYWTLENNSLGEANLNLIEDIGEQNFPGTMVSERRRKGTTKRFRKGLNTSQYSKRAAHAQFKNLIEGARMLVKSRNLVVEMKNYVRSGDSYKAKAGMHDDLVSGCLLCVRMLQTIRAQGIEVGSELSDSFSEDEIFGSPMPIIV